MTINDLKKGEVAKIKEIELDCLPIKLLELGCLPGSDVILLEIAPLGDPLYINVNETYLSISREVARHIEIEKNENQ